MTHPQVELIEKVAQDATLALCEFAKNPDITRDDLALIYGALLHAGIVNWATVNETILTRWSKSGLRYIKEKAWQWRERARAQVRNDPGEANGD